MRRSLATVLTLVVAAAPAAGDVIHLKDGRSVAGRIKRADATEWVVTAADRRATFVPVGDVAFIELTARPTTDPVAAARRLDSLRRAVAPVDDPAKAIEQYRRFTDAGADPATLEQARQDVAVWQDRIDRHLARLGDRWLVPPAREQALDDSLTDAAEARQLLKQGRFAEADPVLTVALAIDPRNVSALYLQGLLRFQQNQLSAARSAFEAVSVRLPDHGPTRINLAVIAWCQGRYADALARYDEAMILVPANPAVLADVSAALSAVAALPPAVGRNPVVGRATQRYQAQQKQLADRMTKRGLHLFGAAWLTDAELADVRKAQRQDQATLDAMTGDFERAQDRVRQTDLAIAEVEAQMRRSAAGALAPGPWLASYDGGDGPPLPTVYVDLGNDADQLRQRRARAVTQLDDLQRQAAAIRRRMAGEPAGGPAQRPVGPEGTPVRPPVP